MKTSNMYLYFNTVIDGKIIKSGNMELVDSLEKDGYKFLNN
jgi:Fe-S cluster assembly ATPase SufC